MRIALFNSTNVNYFVDHAVRLSKLLAEIALVAMVIFSALALGAYLYRRHTRKLSVTTEDLGNGDLRKTHDGNGIKGTNIDGVFNRGQLSRPPPDFNVKVFFNNSAKFCPISLKEPISVLCEEFNCESEFYRIYLGSTSIPMPLKDHYKTFAGYMDELKCNIDDNSTFHIFIRKKDTQ